MVILIFCITVIFFVDAYLFYKKACVSEFNGYIFNASLSASNVLCGMFGLYLLFRS